jgi:hypothetical protein
MPAPINHVAQVATYLNSGLGTSKEKLIAAGKMLWAAKVLAGDWTPDLLAKATKALSVLTQGNKIEVTVGRMDEAAAGKCLKQFTKEVTDLAAELTQARTRKRAGVA